MTVFGIETNYKELTKHGLVNFFYGALAAGLPIAIYIATELIKTGAENLKISLLIVLLAVGCYSTFLSIILNRDKYQTWLGRFFIFPLSYSLGFVTMFYLSILKYS